MSTVRRTTYGSGGFDIQAQNSNIATEEDIPAPVNIGRADQVLLAPPPSGNDDTRVIQGLIDAANVTFADGGMPVEVVLPATPYTAPYFVTQLKIRSGVRFGAVGPYATILRATPTNTLDMIIPFDGSQHYYSIENLFLDGNRANNANSFYGVKLTYDSSIYNGVATPAAGTAPPLADAAYKGFGAYHTDALAYVSGVVAGYFTGTGFHFGHVSAHIDRCYAIWCKNHGFEVSGTEQFFDKCEAVNIGNEGWVVSGGANLIRSAGAYWPGRNPDTRFGVGLLVTGNDNDITIQTQDTYSHAVYLGNGARRNRIRGTANKPGGYVVVLGNTSGGVQDNDIDLTVGSGGGSGNVPYGLVHITGTGGAIDTAGNRVRLSAPSSVATRMVVGPTNRNTVRINDGASERVAYAASLTVDPYNRTDYAMLLTGDITIVPSWKPGYRGQRLRFRFTQDATGGRAVTFEAAFRVNWTPDTAAGKTNGVEFEYDGGAWVQVGATGIPASTFAVLDAFLRPDNASVGNPDVGPTPTAAATFSILGNILRGVGGTSAFATWDSGIADGTVIADAADGYFTLDASAGLVFRYSDDNNYYVAGPTGLFKIQGGSAGGALVSFAFKPGDHIEVVLAGTSITVKINGTTVGSTTQSFNQTATKHGFRGQAWWGRFGVRA